MSLEEEYVALKDTFPSLAQGHIYKQLQGFVVDDKCIHQQEDATEDLGTDILKSFKAYLKQLKSMCFRDSLREGELQSRIIFFLQKLNELQDLGLPNRAERRMVQNQQVTFSYFG